MQQHVLQALPNGQLVKMMAPVVVSASRATDLPAFYLDWFIERLEKGYLAWQNRFNGRWHYVSLRLCRFIVFWSKNPAPLLSQLGYLQRKGIGCYVQYTLNDYEHEGFEPQVPPLEIRIDTFKQLAKKLGPEGIVWRFDPLLLTNTLGVEQLLEKVVKIGDLLKGYTHKLVFSFADIEGYPQVKRNLLTAGVAYKEWQADSMREFASKLHNYNLSHCWDFQMATCAEAIDLTEYGIAHNRCVDGELMAHIVQYNPKTLVELGLTKLNLLHNALPLASLDTPPIVYHKDQAQRKLCGCMPSKDIGQYDTCPHGCLYCYANSSLERAKENYTRHLGSPHGESIVPSQ